MTLHIGARGCSANFQSSASADTFIVHYPLSIEKSRHRRFLCDGLQLLDSYFASLAVSLAIISSSLVGMTKILTLESSA